MQRDVKNPTSRIKGSVKTENARNMEKGYKKGNGRPGIDDKITFTTKKD